MWTSVRPPSGGSCKRLVIRASCSSGSSTGFSGVSFRIHFRLLRCRGRKIVVEARCTQDPFQSITVRPGTTSSDSQIDFREFLHGS